MSLSPSAVEPENLSSPTSLPRPLPSSLFLPPKLDPTEDPQSPSSSNPSPSSSPDVDRGPNSSPDATGPSLRPDAGPSDTPSTGSPNAPVTKAGLREAVGAAVVTVTNAVAVMAADELEQEFGLWRADKDDVQGISGPASRLLYRRLPDEARGGDAIDIVGVVLALAVYVGKNIRIKQGIRANRETLQGQQSPASP